MSTLFASERINSLVNASFLFFLNLLYHPFYLHLNFPTSPPSYFGTSLHEMASACKKLLGTLLFDSGVSKTDSVLCLTSRLHKLSCCLSVYQQSYRCIYLDISSWFDQCVSTWYSNGPLEDCSYSRLRILCQLLGNKCTCPYFQFQSCTMSWEEKIQVIVFSLGTK